MQSFELIIVIGEYGVAVTHCDSDIIKSNLALNDQDCTELVRELDLEQVDAGAYRVEGFIEEIDREHELSVNNVTSLEIN